MNERQQNDKKHREMQKEAQKRDATSSNDPSHHAPGPDVGNRGEEEETTRKRRVPQRGQEQGTD